jgi:hypothetical protein
MTVPNPKPFKPHRVMFTRAQITEGNALDLGFCIACGAPREECEPDARKYNCDNCGKTEVYGAEELVIMGRMT